MTEPSPTPAFDIRPLAKEFAAGLLIRGILLSLLGGTIFFIVGLLVGLYLPPGGVTTAVLTAIVYSVLGAILGCALALTTTARRLMEKMEPELHRLLEPRINAIVAAVPLGSHGMSIAQFQRELDSKIGAELRAAERAESGLVSRLNGFVMRRITATLRAVFLKDFTAYLTARRETTVTTENAGGFVREKLVGLLLANAGRQISGIRIGALVIGTILCLGPLAVAVVAEALKSSAT